MKSATSAVAFVLTLLVWASVASARDSEWVRYSIPTPPPDGRASCTLLVTATKDAGARGGLFVWLWSFEGEAQIAELGIGSGEQEGCDIFPYRPMGGVALDESEDVFQFEWTLEVHAHPNADCTAGGTAEGGVLLELSGNEVRASLLCQ